MAVFLTSLDTFEYGILTKCFHMHLCPNKDLSFRIQFNLLCSSDILITYRWILQTDYEKTLLIDWTYLKSVDLVNVNPFSNVRHYTFFSVYPWKKFMYPWGYLFHRLRNADLDICLEKQVNRAGKAR